MLDAKKILIKQFWGSGGWKNQKQLNITEEELEYAKKQGYMFDYPEVISHSEYLNRLKKVTSKISKEDVADAFLYSLSTRKLEYRSALGSYWYAISIPDHEFEGMISCSKCKWSPWEERPDDYDKNHGFNVYNFERYKWGGVRFEKASYALFDLEQFLLLDKQMHTPEDERIFRDILKCTSELLPHNKAGALQKLVSSKKVLKSNKQEVSVILNILGICGVLSSKEFPCYYEDFYHDRDCEELTNDYLYPANRWRGSDGINEEYLKMVFGKTFFE